MDVKRYRFISYFKSNDKEFYIVYDKIYGVELEMTPYQYRVKRNELIKDFYKTQRRPE